MQHNRALWLRIFLQKRTYVSEPTFNQRECHLVALPACSVTQLSVRFYHKDSWLKSLIPGCLESVRNWVIWNNCLCYRSTAGSRVVLFILIILILFFRECDTLSEPLIDACRCWYNTALPLGDGGGGSLLLVTVEERIHSVRSVTFGACTPLRRALFLTYFFLANTG